MLCHGHTEACPSSQVFFLAGLLSTYYGDNTARKSELLACFVSLLPPNLPSAAIIISLADCLRNNPTPLCSLQPKAIGQCMCVCVVTGFPLPTGALCSAATLFPHSLCSQRRTNALSCQPVKAGCMAGPFHFILPLFFLSSFCQICFFISGISVSCDEGLWGQCYATP